MKQNKDTIKGKYNRAGELNIYINLLKSGKKDFKITSSNYTKKLESDLFNITLVAEERNKMFFAASNKIKSDIKNNEEKVIPLLTSNRADFFKIYNLKEMHGRQIFAFDISGAYPTALFNKELITKDTFDFIMNRIKKTERLPAIGSIAGKKTIHYYYGGKLCATEVNENIYRPLFFYIVRVVAELMDFCREYVQDVFKKDNILFSWVDCIYLDMTDATADQKEDITVNILNWFDRKGYKVKMEVLKNFNVIEKKNHFRLEYLKKGVPTFHPVPKINDPKNAALHELIFNKKIY